MRSGSKTWQANGLMKMNSFSVAVVLDTQLHLFSAAKILEASGDAAIGQDLEEWAHLQYFAKKVSTPTFVISGGERDGSRAREVVTAALAIGRRVAVITPAEKSNLFPDATVVLPFVDGVPDMFHALLTMLPGSIFAAYRAELLAEPYFRGFSGGRSKEGGGGISRIRTSGTHGLEYLKEDSHDT